MPKVRGAAEVEIVGLMVSLNRMEVGKGGEKCALDEGVICTDFPQRRSWILAESDGISVQP